MKDVWGPVRKGGRSSGEMNPLLFPARTTMLLKMNEERRLPHDFCKRWAGIFLNPSPVIIF